MCLVFPRNDFPNGARWPGHDRANWVVREPTLTALPRSIFCVARLPCMTALGQNRRVWFASLRREIERVRNLQTLQEAL